MSFVNTQISEATFIAFFAISSAAVSYTHLRAHETVLDLVCRLLLEKKGLRLPFSCRNGCCTSCAVKIISGKLEQPEAMGVSQDLKDKGYALLCVAKVIEDIEVETTYYDEVYDLQFGQYFGKGKTRKAPPWEFEED